MALDDKLDPQVMLDGLGHGVLIFDGNGRLAADNLAARTLLSTDLNVIRSQGWGAAVTLFNTGIDDPNDQLDAIQKRALESERPVRFHIFRTGEYMPCWAASIHGKGGGVYTLLTLDSQDWTALSQIMKRFGDEIHDAVDSTQGHIDLITQTLKNADPTATVKDVNRRINGFIVLISTHMHRSKRLLGMLERFEDIRTGALHELVRERRRKINMADLVEDFIEELDEITLVDPETEARDHRSRVQSNVPDGLAVSGNPIYLKSILRELLRNAIMYSLRGTPIKIEAHAVAPKQCIQIDMVDEGYGIRAKEGERVFTPFQRARQPQVIGEFGYGLSLYLCKHEVEAMGGQMWFKSEEGVGTTFSFTLPMWREEPAAVSGTGSFDLSKLGAAASKSDDKTRPSTPADATRPSAEVETKPSSPTNPLRTDTVKAATDKPSTPEADTRKPASSSPANPLKTATVKAAIEKLSKPEADTPKPAADSGSTDTSSATKSDSAGAGSASVSSSSTSSSDQPK